MKTFRLDKINLTNKATVQHLDCSGQIRRRLLDLGICKGTVVIPIFRSMTGDATAYLVRGSTIALRKEDAKNIHVLLNTN